MKLERPLRLSEVDEVQVLNTTDEVVSEEQAVEVCKSLSEAEQGVLAELMRDAPEDGVVTGRVTVRENRGTDQSSGLVEISGTGASMRSTLNAVGVTVERLATALHEGLNARKHVVVSGKTKRIPDYAIRIKYLELAHKLRGDFPSSQNAEISVSYEQRLTQVMARARSLVNKIT